MKRILPTVAAAVLAISATTSQAASLSGTEAITGPSQVISFSEAAPTPIGSGLLQVVLNGDFSDGATSAFDVETAVMTLDTAPGTVRLRNTGGAAIDNNSIAGLSLIGGSAVNVSFNDVELAFAFDLTAGLLSSILADNLFTLSFTMGAGVDFASPPDFVSYSLQYNDVAPVPLPAGGLLLIGGLGGLAALRRRKAAK